MYMCIKNLTLAFFLVHPSTVFGALPLCRSQGGIMEEIKTSIEKLFDQFSSDSLVYANPKRLSYNFSPDIGNYSFVVFNITYK